MKVFLSGPITGIEDYRKNFERAERELAANGDDVMNPAVLPSDGFSQEEYLIITTAMLDVCDTIYMLRGWENSVGAKLELERALKHGYNVMVES